MGILIEGASGAELARSAIYLTLFSRSILARLGLFASFFFLPVSFSVSRRVFAFRFRWRAPYPMQLGHAQGLSVR